MIRKATLEFQHHPYRTAYVYGNAPDNAIGYERGDKIDQFHTLLARLIAKRSPDNHECFEIGGTAVMFSDWVMRTSTEIDIRS